MLRAIPKLKSAWQLAQSGRIGFEKLQTAASYQCVRLASSEHLSERHELPQAAQVVVCGGGVVGCSVAYHLAKLGWTDVIVLEQGR